MRKQKWLKTFNIPVKINGKDFSIPGDKLHAKLKFYENRLRSRDINLKEIIDLEKKLANTLAEHSLLKDKDEIGRRRAEFFKFFKETFIYFFTKFKYKNMKAYRAKFTIAINSLSEHVSNFIEEACTSTDLETSESYMDEQMWTLINRLNGAKSYESKIPSIENYLEKIYITYFKKLNFELDSGKACRLQYFFEDIETIATYIEQPKTFLNFLGALIPKKRDQQRRVFPSMVIALKKLYEKAFISPEVSEFDTHIEKLTKKLKKLKSKVLSVANENIVVAHIGFVCENEKKKVEFISLPIRSNKNIHSMFENYNEGYNYYEKTTDSKHNQRNRLIDDKLKKHVPDKKFNKQADYHSERTLYIYLEQTGVLRKIIQKLSRVLMSKGFFIKDIHRVVLDLHSSRYMCRGCKKATHTVSQPGSDLSKYIRANIKKILHIDMDARKPLLVRTSADIPFEHDLITEPYHRSLKRYKNESLILRDTKEVPPKASLSLADKKAFPKYSFFISSEKPSSKTGITVALNHIEMPIKNAAATKIQSVFRGYNVRKGL